jgi:hypothetical protein
MSKQTPGPWEVISHPIYGFIVGSRAAGDKVVAKLPAGGDLSDADASLIAAAPDLLKACEAMHAWFQEDDRGRWPDPEALQLLRDALAKAYGITFAPEE